MQLLPFYVSLALSLLPLAVAQGRFLTPGGEAGTITYHAGDKVDVEWTGTAAYSILSLGYYSSTNTTVKWLISNSPNYPTSYTWTPRPALDGFSTWEQDQFFLYIVNGTDFGSPIQSPPFNIRKQAATTSAPSTTVSTVTPTASPKASDTPSPVDSGDEGLSTGAKAGIGAGVGGGALLIIGLLAYYFLRRRRNQDSHGVYEAPTDQANRGDDANFAGVHEALAGQAIKDDAHLAGYRGHEKVLTKQTGNPAEAPSTTQDGGRPTAELDTQPGERFELA
ncbi:hypothetical protein PG987_009025 [Apiospora arundinis]